MSQQSKLDERQRQLDEDTKYVLSNASGRRFVAALMDNCGLYHPSPDPGARGVALRLRAKLISLDTKLWSAIEAEILARRIETPKPKKDEDSDE